MSERYARLYALRENLYAQGAPLMIVAGALLKDNQTGKVLAQLKFKNISAKVIKAIKVSVQAFDVSGAPVEGVAEYQYLDLQAKRNAEFGQKAAIPLPNPVTRSFTASITSVIFAEGDSWEAADSPWEQLTAQATLQHTLGNLAEQYKRDTRDQNQFAVTSDRDLWLCTCGAINHDYEDSCHTCKQEKAALLAAMDTALLNEHWEAYKQQQAELAALRKAEQEAKEAAQAEQRRKKKKLAMIILPIVAVILAAVLVVTQIIIPGGKYNDAKALLESGEYVAAEEAFAALGDYSDASQMILECRYQHALAYMKNEDYATAYKMLKDLGSYSDAAEQIKASKRSRAQAHIDASEYAEAYALLDELPKDEAAQEIRLNGKLKQANELMEAGKYDEGYEILESLGEGDLVQESLYSRAQASLEDGMYDVAKALFESLGDYQDSKEMVKECQYQKACAYLADKNYLNADIIFKDLGSYKDCKDKLAESQKLQNEERYQEGLTALKNKQYGTAIEIFKELGNYSDSKSKLAEAQSKYTATRYQEGISALNRGQYKIAAQIFKALGSYQDSATKLTESMYGYVLANKNRKDTITYEYLKTLKAQNYKDTAAIYTDLYKWSVSGGFNTTGDFDTKVTSVKRAGDYLNAWFEISGGTPGETIDLTHTAYWPSGNTYASSWHWEDYEDGMKCGVHWQNGYSCNATGTLTVKVFNLKTGEYLGSASVTLVD